MVGVCRSVVCGVRAVGERGRGKQELGAGRVCLLGGGVGSGWSDAGCWMLDVGCQGAAPPPQTSLVVVEAVKKQEQGMAWARRR